MSELSDIISRSLFPDAPVRPVKVDYDNSMAGAMLVVRRMTELGFFWKSKKGGKIFFVKDDGSKEGQSNYFHEAGIPEAICEAALDALDVPFKRKRPLAVKFLEPAADTRQHRSESFHDLVRRIDELLATSSFSANREDQEE